MRFWKISFISILVDPEQQMSRAAAAEEFWGLCEDFFQFWVCRSILLNLIVWKTFLTLNMSRHECQQSVFSRLGKVYDSRKMVKVKII